MSLRFFDTSNDLYRYMLDASLRESDLLAELREETQAMDGSIMQSAPEAGQFLHVLTRIVGATRAIEVGLYTGYSSLCIATALPDDGYLLACDVDATAAAVAQRYWQRAGVDDRVDLRLAPALDTLDALIDDGQSESYDFIFLDADKENYAAYYDRAYALLRHGGLLVVDNVLWAGRVADLDEQDSETQGIRRLNDRIRDDDRILHSLVPIADGMSLVFKPDAG